MEALRKAGLFQRLLGLGALDMGVALRSPYQEAVSSGLGYHREAISTTAADWELAFWIGGRATGPLVISSDVGLLLGAGIALRQRGPYGLQHLDGHTDFGHNATRNRSSRGGIRCGLCPINAGSA